MTPRTETIYDPTPMHSTHQAEMLRAWLLAEAR